VGLKAGKEPVVSFSQAKGEVNGVEVAVNDRSDSEAANEPDDAGERGSEDGLGPGEREGSRGMVIAGNDAWCERNGEDWDVGQFGGSECWEREVMSDDGVVILGFAEEGLEGFLVYGCDAMVHEEMQCFHSHGF
jgi:hypothetical protein